MDEFEEVNTHGNVSVRQGAIKNSFYNILGKIVAKAGGLVFSIVLARLLLPELFGVYNLVLSLAMIAITFTDLGISKALVRYTSDALGKGQKSKAKSYVRYLFKARITLLLIVVFLILVFGKFISESIFGKPEIFLPLLFSVFYILMKSFEGLVKNLFTITKDLQKVTFMQVFLQVFRILFAVLAILIITDDKFVVPGIFIALSAAVLLSAITGLFFLKKDRYLVFGSNKKSAKSDSKKDIELGRIWSYIGLASIVSISLSFFGSIDTLILGGFVESEFIGFYRAALGLVVAISGLLGFTPVLLPIFTQAKKQQLQKGFNEAFRYLVLITIPAVFGILVVARYFIFAVYGSEYITATIPLYALVFLILVTPFIALYSSLFEAKERISILSGFIVLSLLINIALDFILISYFLGFSQELAILGAGLATVISRGFYLFAIQIKSKTSLAIKTPFSVIIKPLISALIMAGVLIAFSNAVDMNLFYGIIEIFIGIIVYFGCLFVLGGLNQQDIQNLKILISKKR